MVIEMTKCVLPHYHPHEIQDSCLYQVHTPPQSRGGCPGPAPEQGTGT